MLLLDCVWANVNADRLRRGSGVWFNRRDSKSREPLWLRGFESPPLRHVSCGDQGRSTRFSIDSVRSDIRPTNAIRQNLQPDFVRVRAARWRCVRRAFVRKLLKGGRNEQKNIFESHGVGSAPHDDAARDRGRHNSPPMPSGRCRMAIEVGMEATQRNFGWKPFTRRFSARDT